MANYEHDVHIAYRDKKTRKIRRKRVTANTEKEFEEKLAKYNLIAIGDRTIYTTRF